MFRAFNFYRYGDSVFDRPTYPKSFSHTGDFQTFTSTPLCQSMRCATYCNIAIRRFIVCLNHRCRPIAITRCVPFIIVMSFYTVSFMRSCTHVINETFERVRPFFTNKYTPFTICFESYIVRVITSGFHCSPCSIFRTVGHGVGGGCQHDSLRPDASTGFGFPYSETVTTYRNDIPTVTNANPTGFPVRDVIISFKCSKSIEFLTSKINEFRHNILSNIAQIEDMWHSVLSTVFRVACPSHKLSVSYY